MGSGWENKELHKNGLSLQKIRGKQIRNYTPSDHKKLNELIEYFKMTRDISTLTKSQIINKINVNSILLRNKACFYNSINQSDSLFNENLIGNRDVATVIGDGHIKSFKKFIQSELDSNKYVPNTQIIYLKGTMIFE